MSAVRSFTGHDTTPALFINGRFIGGCDGKQSLQFYCTLKTSTKIMNYCT